MCIRDRDCRLLVHAVSCVPGFHHCAAELMRVDQGCVELLTHEAAFLVCCECQKLRPAGDEKEGRPGLTPLEFGGCFLRGKEATAHLWRMGESWCRARGRLVPFAVGFPLEYLMLHDLRVGVDLSRTGRTGWGPRHWPREVSSARSGHQSKCLDY